ncbi:MAG: TraR/DksA C4-type zinc finger protein [Rubritepida sp.]|nr:TraR/DksA C4-type zinc finger protein [Rubritepida sp.]
MDDADRAEIEIERELERRLAARRLERPRTLGEGPRWCAECGEAIPEVRRLTLPGVTLCVDCQARHERRRW